MSLDKDFVSFPHKLYEKVIIYLFELNLNCEGKKNGIYCSDNPVEYLNFILQQNIIIVKTNQEDQIKMSLLDFIAED